MTPCCTKCGLDLARLKEVMAEGDQNNCSPHRGETLGDDAPLSVGCGSDTISEDSLLVEVIAPLPCEPAGYDRSDPVKLKDHGNELFRQEKYLDALDCYEKALAIDQFYKEAWFNKSIVLKKIGRPDQSKVCWGIYKRLSSGEPEAQKK